MARLPTVRVVDPGGYRVINQADFDPGVHQVYVGEDAIATAPDPDLAAMTRADLVALADARGIEVSSRATKADLVAALLEG